MLTEEQLVLNLCNSELREKTLFLLSKVNGSSPSIPPPPRCGG
jgi:hypothetical protein